MRFKKKKTLSFSKIKNSANLSTQKKSIYIGYDPEKNLDINWHSKILIWAFNKEIHDSCVSEHSPNKVAACQL